MIENIVFRLADLLGDTGVRFFFVISGFLITKLLGAEEDRDGKVSIGAFYVRRIFRIMPAFYLYLLTVLVLRRGGMILANDAALLRVKYKQMGYDFCVLDYLDTIGDAYQIADIIICRSGATTVAELKILNKPAILVPFPYATANHQEYNASTLVSSHQGVMMREKELRPDLLAEAIKFRMRSFEKILKPRPVIPEKFPQETLADLILGN